jgi:hypothetical protein
MQVPDRKSMEGGWEVTQHLDDWDTAPGSRRNFHRAEVGVPGWHWDGTWKDTAGSFMDGQKMDRMSKEWVGMLYSAISYTMSRYTEIDEVIYVI